MNPQSPSPSKLSSAQQAALEKRLQLGSKTKRPAKITRRPEGEPARLSFAQQRLWFLSQLEANPHLYNIPLSLRLSGPLDLDRLQAALAEVIRRHEVLRTVFTTVADQVLPSVQPPRPVPCEIIDLTAFPADQREAEAVRLAGLESQKPFDLNEGRLLRVCVIRLAVEEHLAVLSLHHIAADGWSLGILLNELESLYSAWVAGQPSPLPELPIQYADFAYWQHQRFQADPVLENQLSYWKQQLAGAPAVLELPTDHPRPPVQRFEGAYYTYQLPLDVSENVKTVSRQENATPFMTLLAAFQTVLYRYTGQTDIVVGTPIANRTRLEVENLIGFFVNTLALRVSLAGNPTFQALLQRTRTVTLEAYSNQEVPFEKLVEVLNPERSLSHPPLFQVLFNFQNTPSATTRLGSAQISLLEISSQTAKFDLSLSVSETSLGFEIGFEYNTDLFEEATLVRFARHFETILTHALAQPARQISALPLLTQVEQRQLQAWNKTQIDYPHHLGLAPLIEAQVEQTPEAEVVFVPAVGQQQSFSYDTLNRRANQLAHYLRTLGVGPETRVGICLERSLEMLVGLLAVLKAGGAYVPLDPAFPKDRLAYMLADSGAEVLLTQSQLLPELPTGTARCVQLDADWPVIAQGGEANLLQPVTGDHLAYVLYTSGSTGKPKGVQVGQSAVINFLTAMRQAPGLTSQDTLLAVTTLSFDIAGLEIFLPLTTGARLILAGRTITGDGRQLGQVLADSGATVMQATPATWQMLLDSGWRSQPALRLWCGGEALPAELARRLLEGGGTLWNLYGPTETTIWSTAIKIEDEPLSLGRPIANTQIHVLDSFLNPVPVGVPGELYIGGDGLARGYWNLPDLTAEKFVPNPFTPPGRRLYRTGDLARYRPEGTLEYLGRIDHQIKLRGFRIELGEVEAVLTRQPEIREAVVTVRRGSAASADNYLAAYILPTKPLTPGELRSVLKTQLPDYMIPAAFVFLEKFPLTPNGKIDRNALPAPEATSTDSEGDSVAPRTLVEEMVAQIWGDVLGRESISVFENFFDLGGHSLLGTRVMLRLQDGFQLELPLRLLFEAPTIAALSEIIELQLAQELDLASEAEADPPPVNA